MAIEKFLDLFFSERSFIKMNNHAFSNGVVKAGFMFKNDMALGKMILYAGDICLDIIFSKRLIFEEIPGDVREMKDLETFMISESMWTCTCPSKFIHTKLITTCPKCNTSLENQTHIMKPIPQGILDWGDLFVDASTYKVPKEFEDA